MAKIRKEEVKAVRKLGREKSNVYDISVKGPYPIFESNGIFVHNTDSCYFSVYNLLDEEEKEKFDKDTAIALYDKISKEVNMSFSEFMSKSFNVKPENCVIQASREMVASSGIFITKKRYALLFYDKEGKRYDVDGKPGGLKIQGLDSKRADIPEFIRDFLNEVLMEILSGMSNEEIIAKINDYKKNIVKEKKPWEFGIPRKVNDITKYKFVHDFEKGNVERNAVVETFKSMIRATRDKEERTKLRNILKNLERKGKSTVPGHVRAALHWNMLREMFKDYDVSEITDGSRIAVCYVKGSKYFNGKSIAYPVDETNLPDWFTKLEFDVDTMLEKVIDKKVENIMKALNIDMAKLKGNNSTYQSDIFD